MVGYGCGFFSGDYNMRESRLGSLLGSEHRGNDLERATATMPPGTLRQNGILTGHLRKFLDRFFYLGMALLVAAVVIFGFSHTIGENLLHPDTPRPWILPIHAIVFSSWVALFIAQSALVRVSKIALHRRLGIFAAALGSILPFVGVKTALVMQHWRDQREVANDAGLSLPFNDMMTFSIAFGVAIYWRRRPEFHRRLMLIATCCLTGAAFARFPESMVPGNAFYACVDVLILLGVWRDLAVTRRVHAVYRYGLPCMMASQAIAQYLMLASPPLWLAITHRIMQWTA
jgi:uncharacterized membrane protein YozB (DUF420 family)